MKRFLQAKCVVLPLFFISLQGNSELLEQFAPPEYSLTDEFNVDVRSLQPTTRVPTVSIGGDRGISDNVSTMTSSVLPKHEGSTGFNYQFGGNAKMIPLGKEAPHGTPRNIMRVFDQSGSMDFEFYKDGLYLNGVTPITGSYRYVPLGAANHALSVHGVNNEYLLWSKPDGSALFYTHLYTPRASAAST